MLLKPINRMENFSMKMDIIKVYLLSASTALEFCYQILNM